MIRLKAALAGASLIALAASMAPTEPAAATRWDRDFAAGSNAEQQDCRAVVRYDGRGARAVDLYCGAWERPSGFIAAYPASQESAAMARLNDVCTGNATPIDGSRFSQLSQIACAREGGAGLRQVGLVARHGDLIVIGQAFPADWGPMVAAASVLGGLEKPEAVAATATTAPGLAQLQAVYPAGAPGQGAVVNLELLRRRAYEQNAVWSFSAAERDFSELLRAHEAVTPDDQEGAAEILAEIGVNLSGERRFEEAADAFDQAESRARAANARFLLTKIANYRAIDALNQGRRSQAIELAAAANAAREALTAPTRSGAALTAETARQIEDAAAATRPGRGLLMSMGELDQGQRSIILSAQADYIQAVASRGLGKPAEASRHLQRAVDRLTMSEAPPGWLVAQIYKERSRLRAEAGDAFGAVGEAQAGLGLLRRDAPGSRAEGHLLLALADARRAGGNTAGALVDSRAAVAIFARQREAPGMPAEVASSHLEGLRAAWEATRDPALADEYLQTIALVWDGAAARSAAQLAARLGASEGGDAVRGYQDAERNYRAALARRERLSTTSGAEARLVKAADADLARAADRMAIAEAELRSRSPRYVELLSPKLEPAAMRAVLEPGEGYVRMVVAEERLYGVLVTRDGVTPYASDLGETEAQGLTDKVRKSAQLTRSGLLPNYDLKAAQELHDGLFGPIAEQLRGLDRLQIDAGGPLAGVPFAALVTEAPSAEIRAQIAREQNYEGVAWFARDRALAVSLGPAAFVRTRTTPLTPARGAVAFGDFQPDPATAARRIAERRGLSDRCRADLERVLSRLAALPETRQEAELTSAAFGANGRAVVGDAFTDQAFMSDVGVSDAGVLVLATHGVLGLSNCFAEPALLASPGPEGDGLIEASELLDLKLSARLVIMSACDTAGGGRSDAARTGFADGGEALSGLARAFIYAGAHSVLATHWKIDSATSSLQTQKLLSSAAGSGEPLSVALAQAQKEMYDSADTAHPFYWAGFVLIGDGGARLDSPAAPQVAATP